MYFLFFAHIGLLAAKLFPKERTLEWALRTGLFFYGIIGIIALPYYFYVSGFIAWSGLYGVLSLNNAVIKVKGVEFWPHLAWGKDRIDSHEELQIKIENKYYVLDPMANTIHLHPVRHLIANPQLTEESQRKKDAAYFSRDYRLYDTDEWFKRVYRFAVRKNTGDKIHWEWI